VNKLLSKTTLVLFLFITAVTLLWLPTQADEPTAVHLASFDAVPLNNAVRIDWETGTELNTAGFKIKRATIGGNEEFLDNVGDDGFISATGNVTSGSSYTATDNQAQNGAIYTYILFEIENSGTEVELARETVTVGISATNTPVVISGGNNGGNSATSTPRASSTPRSTRATSATPTTTSNSTNPTNTPPSFVTVTPQSTQPTAVPTENSNTTNSNQPVSISTNPTATNEPSQPEDTTISIAGVTEVLAQEESTDNIEAQEEYPVETATVISESAETYPNNATIGNPASSDSSPTAVSIIGSEQENTNTSTNTTSSGENASASKGRVFLWLGFIVALLIFATGLIGSIILFTRKSK